MPVALDALTDAELDEALASLCAARKAADVDVLLEERFARAHG